MVMKIKKPLAVIATVTMSLMLAVSTVVPAYAMDPAQYIAIMGPAFAAAANAETDNNPQIVYDEPDLGESGITDNYITLPDVPAKDGYTFKGWRVNGGGELYNAGDIFIKDGSEEIHLQPVYEAATGVTTEDKGVSSNEEEPDLLNQYEDGSDIVLQYGHDNILTLPDAKKKEGYDFYGWCVNGNTTDLYKSGSTIPIKAREKVTFSPVYVSTKEADNFTKNYGMAAIICFVLFFVSCLAACADTLYEVSGILQAFGVFWLIAAFALAVFALYGRDNVMQQALADTLQQLKYMTP